MSLAREPAATDTEFSIGVLKPDGALRLTDGFF
jgi:hypothetical protein